MLKRPVILLLILAFIIGVLPAKETTKKKSRIIFSPLVFYTPETRIAFGAAGSLIFRPSASKKKTRPSSISPLIIYTQEKQFKAILSTRIYFKNNDHRLETEVKFEKYPNKFYGIGPDTLESDEEAYTPRSVGFQVSFYKKLFEGFDIGLGYHFLDWRITKTIPGGQLAKGNIYGSENGTISGIRFILERDSRDHIFSPRKGELYKFDARFYLKFLGSTFDYNSFTIDLRKYFKLFSNHVFAVQSLLKIQGGTVPFLQLAQIGGQYIMRGYYQGRYRDKNLLAIQAEYRAPLIWRFGLVGFAGVANVSGKFNRLNLGDLKSSYGIGLRYLFSRNEKIQIRFDIGFGEGTSGFYASIYEAF